MMRQGQAAQIGLSAGGDSHLADQVARLARAAGAAVVTDGRADVWLVAEGQDSGPGPRRPDGVPVIRVRYGGRTREPVGWVDPDSSQVLELPADDAPLLRYVGSLSLSSRAQIVAVLGARGGAGASTMAAALARAAARAGTCAALVDLDAAGGLDLLLGVEHEPGPRWADLRSERTGFPAQALSLALPRWNDVRVLSGDGRGGPRVGDPGVADALRALVSEHDLVVLDVPRNGPWSPHGGEMGAPGMPRWHQVLLVATCDVRSAAAAGVVARQLGDVDARLIARSPGPGGLDPDVVAEACGLPLAARTRTERGSAAASERGEAPGDHRRGTIARTASRLVAELGLAP